MAATSGSMALRSRRLRTLAMAALLLGAALLAYGPALRGGLLWDDEGHVTKPELRSLAGLGRIWTHLGATQQYYPVLHTAFWIEHRLWGDATLGYHLLNVLLHVCSACLVALILRRLWSEPLADGHERRRYAGAEWVAAWIFALHPVMVESVAWIAEQKNTLSTVFYLLAVLAYLRFDERRRWSWYALALGAFVLALGTKSVTATLPGALLVVLWWRHGRLEWRRDVAPLVPWFAAGLAMGLLTSWVERRLIGAEGVEFNLHGVERGLLAGRVVWFYLGKLVWPSDMIFIYPRWNVSAAAAWQYLAPAGVAVLLGALWWVRGRARGPLAAALFFGGTLFPALGFFNVYPFVYSYVADHFQYLASLGIIVLAAGAWGWAWSNPPARPGLRHGLLALAAGGVIGTLGVLTWRQSRAYRDLSTLYRATVERNPACWMAAFNLGNLYLGEHHPDEAATWFEQALRARPDYPEAYNNLGDAQRALGRSADACASYGAALRLKPAYAEAHFNLGIMEQEAGRIAEAEADYSAALRLRPDFRAAHVYLGNLLRQSGRLEAAIPRYESALQLQPADAAVQSTLADALEATGHPAASVAHYEAALRLQPGQADTEDSLGIALAESGRLDDAVTHFERALQLRPAFPEAQNNLGSALMQAGRFGEAARHFESALQLKPDYPEARDNLRLARQRAAGLR